METTLAWMPKAALLSLVLAVVVQAMILGQAIQAAVLVTLVGDG